MSRTVDGFRMTGVWLACVAWLTSCGEKKVDLRQSEVIADPSAASGSADADGQTQKEPAQGGPTHVGQIVQATGCRIYLSPTEPAGH